MARYYAESNLRSNNKVDLRKIESGEYYRQARKDITVKQFCKWLKNGFSYVKM